MSTMMRLPGVLLLSFSMRSEIPTRESLWCQATLDREWGDIGKIISVLFFLCGRPWFLALQCFCYFIRVQSFFRAIFISLQLFGYYFYFCEGDKFWGLLGLYLSGITLIDFFSYCSILIKSRISDRWKKEREERVMIGSGFVCSGKQTNYSGHCILEF